MNSFPRNKKAVRSGMIRITVFSIFLIFCPNPGIRAETSYYRSNSLGVKIEAIGSNANRKGYVLAEEKEGSLERAILYEDGKKIQTRLTEYLRDGTVKTTISDPENVRSIEYTDASGRMTAEERFVHGELSEKAVFRYEGGQVKAVTVSDGKGVLQYTDTYERTSDGRLRKIIRTYPDGSTKRSSFGFAGERLREEITNINGTSELVRYGRTGDVQSRETWEGEKLVSREVFVYADGKLVSSSVTMESEKNVIKKKYSSEGFAIEEVREKNGKPEQTIVREYKDGNLSMEAVRTKGLLEEKRYEYDADGKLLTEKYIKNGIPEKLIVWTAEKTYTEELYRNGEVFMKITYVDGKKTTEEFIRKGETLRTRRAGNP